MRWRILRVVSIKVAFFFCHIQAFAAQEIRALERLHHLPWGMFMFLVWVLTRPPCKLFYWIARVAHRKEMDALGLAPVQLRGNPRC